MTPEQILQELEALGNESVRKQNNRSGATGKQFGVRLGDIRKLAKAHKAHAALAPALWDSDNLDARLLAILWTKPKALSVDRVDAMVRSVQFTQVADWLSAYVLKKHPEREALRTRWLATDHPMAARAGWSLTNERVLKDPAGLDLSALLDRIEAEALAAPEVVQWTMNFTLAAIGIHHPEHRERARAIGEALGLYRDYPVSKGCTSPYAPIWIDAMVARQ